MKPHIQLIKPPKAEGHSIGDNRAIKNNNKMYEWDGLNIRYV